ncbi:MAG: hypothetical protein ACI8V4_002496 [Ilumatobacter sp.]|jgi:hypothetical protein
MRVRHPLSTPARAIQRDLAEQPQRELTSVGVRVGVAIVDNDAFARRCLTASRIKKECLRGSVAVDGVSVQEVSK